MGSVCDQSGEMSGRKRWVAEGCEGSENVRMLIYEGCGIVDFVMDDQVEILRKGQSAGCFVTGGWVLAHFL